MANRLKGLREDRAEKAQQYDELVELAQKRELTDTEKNTEFRLYREIEELDKEIGPLEAKERRTKDSLKSQFLREGWGQEEAEDLSSGVFDFQIKKAAPIRRNAPISDWVLRNYDVDEDAQKADVFEVIAALAGRKRVSKSALAALATIKTGVSGSATLTEFLSARMWEVGLAKSHLASSGMQVFNMDEPSVRFARISEYPSLEWKAALASTTERTVGFDSVDGDAATLRGWVDIGAELLQDGHNISSGIRKAFTKSIMTEVDRTGGWGSGSGEEPLGIRNYVGVPTFELNDNLESYDPFVEAQKLAWDENSGDFDTAIGPPTMLLSLGKLKGESEFQPVRPPKVLENWSFLQTSKVPQNEAVPANRYSIVCGGFNSLHLGIRLNTTISISPVEAATYSYRILGAFRGQFFAERVEDFAIITKVAADPTT